MDERVGHPRARWAWWSLAPLGLGAWAPLWAGRRAGRRSWTLWGAGWTLVTLGGWVAAIAGRLSLGASCVAVGWAGSVVTTFSIHRRWSPGGPVQITARDRRRRELALAKERLRTRPDVIDVNVATLVQLLRVPVIDGTIAGRIITVREQVGGFTSLDEMGIVLALGDEFIEKLREWVVCEPRSGATR